MSDLAHYDEDAFSDELPDVALEVAGERLGTGRESLHVCILHGIRHLSSTAPR
jgi:hypothetical protein